MLDDGWNRELLIDGAKYLPLKDFSVRYNISEAMIHIANRDVGFKQFIRAIDGKLYINHSSLLRHRAFIQSIYNKSHDNYYALIEHLNEAKLSTLLAKYSIKYTNRQTWVSLLARGLFDIAWQDKSILSYKISPIVWEFYRYTTAMIRHINRLEDKHNGD